MATAANCHVHGGVQYVDVVYGYDRSGFVFYYTRVVNSYCSGITDEVSGFTTRV